MLCGFAFVPRLTTVPPAGAGAFSVTVTVAALPLVTGLVTVNWLSVRVFEMVTEVAGLDRDRTPDELIAVAVTE
jgi:hypothetical protein